MPACFGLVALAVFVDVFGAVLFDDLDGVAVGVEEEVAHKSAFVGLHGFAAEVVVGHYSGWGRRFPAAV
jgi:hypothetical protein